MKNLMKRGDETLARQPNGEATPAEEQFIQPRVSVLEDADAVTVHLEMPGVNRDKIEVTVEHDELTVTGWRHAEDYSNVEVLHRERLPFKYRRGFILSEQIAADRIEAAYDNGVLRLTLPKSEGAKPRKIEIQ